MLISKSYPLMAGASFLLLSLASACGDSGSGVSQDARVSSDSGVTLVDGSSTFPVNLGAAGSFGILAKSGSSTVPTSAVTGNLGISPAAGTFITGFSLTADATNVFSGTSGATGNGGTGGTSLVTCSPACTGGSTGTSGTSVAGGTTVSSPSQECVLGGCLARDGEPCSSNGDCAAGICSKFYADGDSDHYPVVSDSLGWCNVTTAQVGGYIPARSDGQWDCCDTDAQVNPGQTEYFDVASATCGWDHNCDGAVEKMVEPHAMDTCGLRARGTCVLVTADGSPRQDCGTPGYAYITACDPMCTPSSWAQTSVSVRCR